MTVRFPAPSKRYRMELGSHISWFLNNHWIQFHILSEHADLPEDAVLIGHKIEDDHLEEIYQLGDQFFRYAGGGRGFYWTQELTIENQRGGK